MTTPQQFGHAISLVPAAIRVQAACMRLRRSDRQPTGALTARVAHWEETGDVPGPPAIVRAPRAGDLVEHPEVRQVA